jgi:outer membrane protein W
LVATLAVAAAAKANFSGTWIMDAAKSEGMPPGLEQTLTVKQDGDKIETDVKAKSPQGDLALTDSYTLDGKEVEFVNKMFRGMTGNGKRTTKWAADGNGIEINETTDVQAPDGSMVTIKAKRTWTLSADAKTLVIEQTLDTPQGTQHSKRVFNKQ